MCDHDQSNVLAWKRRSHGLFFHCCASSTGQRGGNDPLMEPRDRPLVSPDVCDTDGALFSASAAQTLFSDYSH